MAIEGRAIVGRAVGGTGHLPDPDASGLLRQGLTEIEVPGSPAVGGQTAAGDDFRSHFIA
jgi:hypothetical protein